MSERLLAGRSRTRTIVLLQLHEARPCQARRNLCWCAQCSTCKASPKWVIKASLAPHSLACFFVPNTSQTHCKSFLYFRIINVSSHALPSTVREYLSDNGNCHVSVMCYFTSYPSRVNNNGSLIYMLYATFLFCCSLGCIYIVLNSVSTDIVHIPKKTNQIYMVLKHRITFLLQNKRVLSYSI